MVRIASHARRDRNSRSDARADDVDIGSIHGSCDGPWHNNVNVYENSGGLGYTGLRVERSGYLSGLILANCNWPVYDTMWVRIPKPSGVWLELGVRYVCDIYGHAYHDVFMGYGTCSTCFNWQKYTNDGTSSATHTYAITQDYGGDYWWAMNVDGTNEWNDWFQNQSTSDMLQVVLETYDDATVIPSHSIHDFKKRRYANDWAAWSGEDSGPTNPPSPLCGYWTSSTSMQAGENVTC